MNRTRTSLVTWLAIVGASVIVLTGCGDGDGGSTDSRVQVVATTTILGDVAANVVGSKGNVEVLLPIGADPHDYQASSQQVALIQEADLVIVNGLGLEEGLEDVLESAAEDGAKILSIGEQLDPLPFDPSEPNSLDPHIWLDPRRMAEAADLIASTLVGVDPTGTWSEQAHVYALELLAADEEVRSTLEAVPEASRKLVANHRSLGYFADRYGFEVIGTVIPGGSTLADPSSAELAELVAVIEAENVPAIFAETTESAALAEAVAEEVGRPIEVVDLYTGSLGEPGSGAETLIGMLLANARLIAEALS